MLKAEILKYARWTDPENRYGGKIGELVRTGPTPAAAREAVESAAVEALSGSYTPVMFAAGGWTALIFRLPNSGWTYRLIGAGELSPKRKFVWGGSDMGDFEMIERAARRHLGSLIPEDDPEGWDVLTNDDDRRRRATDLTWQRKMRALTDNGIPDGDAHRIAGGLEAWPATIPLPEPVILTSEDAA